MWRQIDLQISSKYGLETVASLGMTLDCFPTSFSCKGKNATENCDVANVLWISASYGAYPCVGTLGSRVI
jgi:hypothetical protein